MALTTQTLIYLPPQLPPPENVADGTVITTWLFILLLLTLCFFWLLFSDRTAPTQYKTICLGSLLLTIWYLFAAVDRWIHYDQRTLLPYYYVLIPPLMEAFRQASAILQIWGTYKVLLLEFDRRLDQRNKKWWWFASKLAIFVAILVSTFYVALAVSAAIVWLLFRNLNVIDDVCSKRNNFELSTNVFFSMFCLLTLVGATWAIYRAAPKRDGGSPPKYRILLWLGSCMLLGRSVTELGLAVSSHSPGVDRQSMRLVRDLTYGIFTVFFLAFLYGLAYFVTKCSDGNSLAARGIKDQVRGYILTYLDDVSKRAHQQSPPFNDVLNIVSNDIDRFVSTRPSDSGETAEKSRHDALACIAELRKEYGGRGEDLRATNALSSPTETTLRPQPHRNRRGVRPATSEASSSVADDSSTYRPNPRPRASRSRLSPTPDGEHLTAQAGARR